MSTHGMTQIPPDHISGRKVQALIAELAQYPIAPDGSAKNLEEISSHLELLFIELGTEDIGEVVADAVHRGLLTQQQGGAYLNIAVWSGRTNGAQLQPTIERWLEEGKDPTRVGLALAQGTFPFIDSKAMSRILLRIASGYPEFAPIIYRTIDNRRRQDV